MSAVLTRSRALKLKLRVITYPRRRPLLPLQRKDAPRFALRSPHCNLSRLHRGPQSFMKKLLNILRCYWNYALSRMGLVRISHAPLFVSVEPAAVCQLHCPECPVGLAFGNKLARVHTAPLNEQATYAPFMSMDLFRKVLNEVKAYAHTMQFYFQGEPLLNKDLPQMVKEAHEAGLYTIVSTNAQAMTPEMAQALVNAGLSRIIVSMDGLTQATYGAYRVGGDIEKCKAALRYLREARGERRKARGTVIELQCLRLKTNEHEWQELQRVYKSLGADTLTLKTAQLYDYEKGHPLMPSEARYSRYEKGADGRFHRKHLRRGCLRVWSGVVVTTTGEVLPCCYDKSHAYAYGNISDAPIAELFRNEKAQAFRRAALHEQPKICQECWK